jgi:FlaA1/EpsC-like NDP-sugar epimerase
MRINGASIKEYLYSEARVIFCNHSLPRWMVFLFDGSAVFLTFIFSYILRFNFEPEVIDFGVAFRQSLIVMAIYCVFELIFRSYAGLIRHTTIRDIFNIILTTVGSVIFLITLTILSRRNGWYELLNIPLSIILIHFVTINALLFTTRILIKMSYEMITVKPTTKKNVIIFGAGSMGVIVERVIMSDTSNCYHIVAFLDHNKKLQRKNLNGIPIFAPQKLTQTFIEKYQVKTMIFAIREIAVAQKTDIYRFAVNLGLEVLEVPAVNNWLNGQFQLKQLKRIRIQDLLTRAPIQLNTKRIAKELINKRILVTGAAGSIGSEIVRLLTRFNIEKTILIDNAETPMFHLENELQEHYGHAPVRTILGDVTDEKKMDRIFRECLPEIVFHAAAYKHVTMMEENPYEAMRVNVGGTLLLTRLAMKYGVGKFVMVSTDKAVNPTNVMGASKRLCEMIVRSRSMTTGNTTQFVITRFGNVLGSNGSVVPIFRRQIEAGGPVTVTHPEITRYFMTIPEACQLVLEAGLMGTGGEIFVFDMGEPVKIDMLARQMIKLTGYIPDEDIKIEYIGLRPGEKLYEELLTKEENTLPTYNPKIKIARISPIDPEKVISGIHGLLCSYQTISEHELVKKIRAIIPEYRSTNEKYFDSADGPESVEVEAS